LAGVCVHACQHIAFAQIDMHAMRCVYVLLFFLGLGSALTFTEWQDALRLLTSSVRQGVTQLNMAGTTGFLVCECRPVLGGRVCAGWDVGGDGTEREA
jgi:hypothetical protein